MARAYLSQSQVISSAWAPPLLRGVVRVGDVHFRASLVIKDEIDIENPCTCRRAPGIAAASTDTAAIGRIFSPHQPIGCG